MLPGIIVIWRGLSCLAEIRIGAEAKSQGVIDRLIARLPIKQLFSNSNTHCQK
jgi:hypothetical protein